MRGVFRREALMPCGLSVVEPPFEMPSEFSRHVAHSVGKKLLHCAGRESQALPAIPNDPRSVIAIYREPTSQPLLQLVVIEAVVEVQKDRK